MSYMPSPTTSDTISRMSTFRAKVGARDDIVRKNMSAKYADVGYDTSTNKLLGRQPTNLTHQVISDYRAWVDDIHAKISGQMFSIRPTPVPDLKKARDTIVDAITERIEEDYIDKLMDAAGNVGEAVSSSTGSDIGLSRALSMLGDFGEAPTVSDEDIKEAFVENIEQIVSIHSDEAMESVSLLLQDVKDLFQESGAADVYIEAVRLLGEKDVVVVGFTDDTLIHVNKWGGSKIRNYATNIPELRIVDEFICSDDADNMQDMTAVGERMRFTLLETKELLSRKNEWLDKDVVKEMLEYFEDMDRDWEESFITKSEHVKCASWGEYPEDTLPVYRIYRRNQKREVVETLFVNGVEIFHKETGSSEYPYAATSYVQKRGEFSGDSIGSMILTHHYMYNKMQDDRYINIRSHSDDTTIVDSSLAADGADYESGSTYVLPDGTATQGRTSGFVDVISTPYKGVAISREQRDTEQLARVETGVSTIEIPDLQSNVRTEVMLEIALSQSSRHIRHAVVSANKNLLVPYIKEVTKRLIGKEGGRYSNIDSSVIVEGIDGVLRQQAALVSAKTNMLEMSEFAGRGLVGQDAVDRAAKRYQRASGNTDATGNIIKDLSGVPNGG